jgi:iron complex outermembrane receptor protein
MKVLFPLVVLTVPFQVLSNDTNLIVDFDDEFSGMDLQSILTSTKLETSRKDAPATITKISSDQIARNKYRDIPEALRSVPGMVVVAKHTGELMYAVGYHGGNSTVPRRMNVLIDGVSFYQSGFARIRWEMLPVDMHNIHSIEVIRGPAASLYGSNSFTSVVNINTKTAKQTVGKANELGVFSNVFVGDGGVLNSTLRYTHLFEKTGVNLTYTHKEDDGFDHTSNGDERRDNKEIDSLVLQVNHEIDEKQAVNFTFSVTDEEVQEQFIAPIQTSFPDFKVEAIYAAFTYTNDLSKDGHLQIRGYAKKDKQSQAWNTQVPTMTLSPELSKMFDMNPSYAFALSQGQIPSDGSSADDLQAFTVLQQAASLGSEAFGVIDATVLQNYTEEHYRFEMEYSQKINDDLRYVMGASIDYALTTNYDWIISSPQSLETKLFFANIEYSLSDNWLLNTGASYEYNEESGGSLSPRLALINRYFDDYSFRFIVSSAERTPDTFEQKANWRYVGTNLSSNPFNDDEKLTYFIKAVARGDLKAEEITSWEIGMLFEPLNSDFSLDIRTFYEEQTSLIDERITFFDFDLTNNSQATIRGAEFELNYPISDSTLFNASYSYTDTDNGTDSYGVAQSLSVKNTFYFSLNHKINEKFSANIYCYGLDSFVSQVEHNFSEPVNIPDFHFFEANIAYQQAIPNFGQVEISLHLRHRSKDNELEPDNFYDDSNAYFLNASIAF